MTKRNDDGFNMDRRDFVKSSSLMAGGLMLSPALLASLKEERQFLVNSPLNTKTNIKIIVTELFIDRLRVSTTAKFTSSV